MASFTTVLDFWTGSDHTRKWTTLAHTLVKQNTWEQKRIVGAKISDSSTDKVLIRVGTANALGEPLTEPVLIEINVRRPREAAQADMDTAVTQARDFVASDQFAAMVATQAFIGP